MTIQHFSPAEFSKGTTARTKQDLLNEVLSKTYNNVPTYKTLKGLTVNNLNCFVNLSGINRANPLSSKN